MLFCNVNKLPNDYNVKNTFSKKWKLQNNKHKHILDHLVNNLNILYIIYPTYYTHLKIIVNSHCNTVCFINHNKRNHEKSWRCT